MLIFSTLFPLHLFKPRVNIIYQWLNWSMLRHCSHCIEFVTNRKMKLVIIVVFRLFPCRVSVARSENRIFRLSITVKCIVQIKNKQSNKFSCIKMLVSWVWHGTECTFIFFGALFRLSQCSGAKRKKNKWKKEASNGWWDPESTTARHSSFLLLISSVIAKLAYNFLSSFK